MSDIGKHISITVIIILVQSKYRNHSSVEASFPNTIVGTESVDNLIVRDALNTKSSGPCLIIYGPQNRSDS
jgi:hypothetical protein